MITDIESQLHLVTEIDTHPADVETESSYAERIGDYEANNYTYIPIPIESKYYSTEEGWLRDMNTEQIVDRDTHIMEILRRLQNQPFLLVDYLDLEYYYVFDNGGQTHAFEESFISPDEAGSIEMSIGNFEVTSDDFEDKSDEDAFTVHELRQEYPEVAGSALDHDYEDQYGIVTIADVNKRGVKQMLYKLISELSASLGMKIQNKYTESENIQKHLRPVTIGRWRKDQMNGLEMHISEHMNLIEMMQIIQSSEMGFVEECGFKSKRMSRSSME